MQIATIPPSRPPRGSAAQEGKKILSIKQGDAISYLILPLRKLAFWDNLHSVSRRSQPRAREKRAQPKGIIIALVGMRRRSIIIPPCSAKKAELIKKAPQKIKGAFFVGFFYASHPLARRPCSCQPPQLVALFPQSRATSNHQAPYMQQPQRVSKLQIAPLPSPRGGSAAQEGSPCVVGVALVCRRGLPSSAVVCCFYLPPHAVSCSGFALTHSSASRSPPSLPSRAAPNKSHS